MSDDPNRAGRAADRRRFARQRVRLAAILRPANVPDGFYGNAWVEDISAGGLRLRLDYPLPPGALLTVDLSSPNLPHNLRVRVVYAAQAGATWRAGCAFEPAPGGESGQSLGG